MASTLGANHASHEKGGLEPLLNTDFTPIRKKIPSLSDDNASHSDDIVQQSENNLTPSQLFSFCQSEFNRGRKVLIKNIPSLATTQDIESFVTDFEVKSIDYDCQSQQAVVVLEHGEEVETVVEALDNTPLLDVSVSVCPSPSDSLLCLAHLPAHYTDSQLLKLATEHGKTKRAFLMRCQKTGESKGYGFVEYDECVERTQEIASELDWSEVEGQRLHVELVEENLQAWIKLQSRCLLLSNLPWDFMDISKLRHMFSCVTSPVYCQIAAKDGKSLGYGIIEFREPQEAESTWEKLSGEEIQDRPVSLSFCIPGRPAVVIYNRIMWKMDKKLEPSMKSSLLPDPLFVSPALLSSPLVKGLTTQFPQLIPTFMKCLHQLHQAYINSVMSRNTKPGLLGPAPYPPISPIMNPNMQLGLIIFIALQIQVRQPQQFTGPLARQLNLLGQLTEKTSGSVKPSLLGEPMAARANMLLQNLQVQLHSSVSTQSSVSTPSSLPNTETSTPKPLMSTHPELPASDPKAAIFYQQHLQNIKNLNLNLLISLGQVMFSMQNHQPDPSEHQPQSTPASSQRSNHMKEGLLPNPAAPNIRNGPMVKPLLNRTGPEPMCNVFAKNLSNVVPHPLPRQSGHEPTPLLSGLNTEAVGKTSLLGEPPSRQYGAVSKDQSCYSNVGQGSRSSHSMVKQMASEGDYWVGNSFSGDDSGYGELSEYSHQRQFAETMPLGCLNNGNSSNSNTLLPNIKTLSPRSSDPTSMSYSGGGLLPTPLGVTSAYNPPSQNKVLPVMSTPMGQKRSYSSLLPEPEPSPEGNYIIGQHSQGIGGHYADSYRKRQKLNHHY